MTPRPLGRIAGTIGAIAAAGSLALAGSAAAATSTNHAVFVQTDNSAGNQIVAYDRAPDGTLRKAATYDTGGLGGQLEGSVSDHLGSQGSLAFDAADNLLYAVNAQSNTISVFAVFGDRLALRQVLSSGGTFPVSIAVGDGVVYVLNALEGAALQGFRVLSGRLVPIPGSNVGLGLSTTETPQFTHTPGDVTFSPDDGQLIVTTKAAGEDVDVFAVDSLGRLSSPTINHLAGTVPFAATFDKQGHLVLGEAAGFIAGFELQEDGTIAQLDAVPTGQTATCWVTRVRDRFFYTSNTASGTLSGFRSEASGQLLAPLGNTTTDAGTVDAASPDGRFLYVQAGIPGTVDEFAVANDGSLTSIGSVTVPGAVGGEGIVAP